MAPTPVTSCTALPPEGALRLRPDKAGSAALAVEEGAPMLATLRAALLPEGALRLRPGKAGSASLAVEEGASKPVTSCTAMPAYA